MVESQADLEFEAVRNYTNSTDLDKKALVLNHDIVVREGNRVKSSSLNLIKDLHDIQSTGVSVQYRSDVICGLDSENLVAVANTLSSGNYGVTTRQQAVEDIRSAADKRTVVDQDKEFNDDVIAELTERLQDSIKFDSDEIRDLISAIDEMATVDFVMNLKNHPDLLAVLVSVVKQFHNEDLRDAIEKAWDSLES